MSIQPLTKTARSATPERYRNMSLEFYRATIRNFAWPCQRQPILCLRPSSDGQYGKMRSQPLWELPFAACNCSQLSPPGKSRDLFVLSWSTLPCILKPDPTYPVAIEALRCQLSLTAHGKLGKPLRIDRRKLRKGYCWLLLYQDSMSARSKR